jgi:hypothetical protein
VALSVLLLAGLGVYVLAMTRAATAQVNATIFKARAILTQAGRGR